MIFERRDLKWETANAGSACARLNQIPPCVYSVNAFGSDQLRAFADPPEFFRDGDRREWDLPPATVTIWPYEEMYGEDLRTSGRYDYDLRLERAKEYFSAIIPDHSLIIYYANYSNPFSTDDARRYAIVGLSRIRKLGDIEYYENCSEDTRKQFGGGFVWQRNVTSWYPEQGMRIPFHRYLGNEEVLRQIHFSPDNPRNFKYGTRHISDDDALAIVERFIVISETLRELGDRSEDWSLRTAWLRGLIAELWQHRGLYPGMPAVLDVLGFTEAISFFRDSVATGQEQDAREQIVACLEGRWPTQGVLKNISAERQRKIQRAWKLRDKHEQSCLRDVLPRFAIDADQITRVLSKDRSNWGIACTIEDVSANPYVLCESYAGGGPDDTIGFGTVDQGVLPSPELGGTSLFDKDDWRRLRAAAVHRLKIESRQSFLPLPVVIHDVNKRLAALSDWRRHEFNDRYVDVDEDELSGALTFRRDADRRYVYLRKVFEDERLLETTIRELCNGKDITFRSPVTDAHWRNFLRDPNSVVARLDPVEYERIIAEQSEACQRAFRRPFSVVSGAAGTGKTTVIGALMKAIEKAHGATSFKLLAPTGKAADRIRERVGKDSSTIHSFLASKGWLNENFTLKRVGGSREEDVATVIIDEASMLDVELAAVLFRAFNWRTVQRVILVGDSSQLPPIGRGRVFAEIVDWLSAEQPDSIIWLKTNIRQLENRLNKTGTGILEVAHLFTRTAAAVPALSYGAKAEAESVLQRLQEGGDVDRDLRVIFWKSPSDLATKLKYAIVTDIATDCGIRPDGMKSWEYWKKAFTGGGVERMPHRLQILSPLRGNEVGTERLNAVVQELVHGSTPQHGRHLDGIALGDKVIQIRNRPKSNRITAYNASTRKAERVEVYNGELGFVAPHAFDAAKLRSPHFRLQRFQVSFARKEHLRVGYGKDLGKDDRGYWIKEEKVEDNLELAYAISVHKAQGSEFDRVYFILPRAHAGLVSRELLYTAMTRASRHCTLLIEEDIRPLISATRIERSDLAGRNSSVFSFQPIPDELLFFGSWYEEGKIHRTLADVMVRSKSEVIISNMLWDREIPFRYETPLFAPDGTFYLPDFTITFRGESFFWEHFGLMDKPAYKAHADVKRAWYDKHFAGKLIVTEEGPDLSKNALTAIERHFAS